MGSTPDTTTPGSHVASLDGLRAVAVLAVIGYHFDVLHLRGGYLGVDLFFVLSGFLITRLLLAEHDRSGTIGLRRFWARRVRRLTPAILLLMAAVAVWGSFVLDPFSLRNLRNDMFATLGYVANWRFIAADQSYFSAYSDASPLRHMWSLAIEEQFYMVWPVLVLVALRIGRGRRRLLAGIVLALIAGSTSLLWVLYDSSDPSRAYYGTDTRLAQLLVGALLAIVASRVVFGRRRPRSAVAPAAIGFLALVGIVACVFTIDDRAMFMYRGGFLGFSVLVAILLWAVMNSRGLLLDRMLSWRPAVWVGQISYGLYLWHWPVQVAFSPERSGLDGEVLALVRLAATFVVTLASYHVVEQPVRYTRGWAGRFVGGRAVLAAGTSVLAVCGTIVVATRDSAALPDYLDTTSGEVVENDGEAARPGGRTILVTGDSLSMSVQEQVRDLATRRGIGFFARSLPGCSMTRGLPVDGDGEIFEAGDACALSHDDFVTGTADNRVSDAIVWMSSWDAWDRLVDGVLYRSGTPEWDAKMTELVDETVTVLSRRGARIFLVSAAPVAPDNELSHADPAFDSRVGHYNRVLRSYATAHPESTSFIDLASRVCPAGPPCPAVVGAITLRPRDGVHFDGEGARWAASIIFDAVAADLGW